MYKIFTFIVFASLLYGCGITSNQSTHKIDLTDRNNPQLVKRVNPYYPKDAAKKRVNGVVKMSFDINKQGNPVNIKVIDSSPKRIFDKSAVNTLSKWRYNPKVVNGQPLYTKGLTVSLTYKLM